MIKYSVLVLLFFFVLCASGDWDDLKRMNIKGKVVGIYEKTYNLDETLISTKEYTFNNLGNITIVKNTFESNTISFKSTIQYNRSGRIKEQLLFECDSLILKQHCLNLNINKDSILMYDPDDKVVGTAVMNYNENGQLVESLGYNENIVLIYSEHSKYENYLLTESCVYDSSQGNIKYEYEYDSLNRIQFYSYITEDVEIKEEYKYKIDENGNWISKSVFDEKGNLKKSIKREINYK